MDEIKNMLEAVINGQHALRAEFSNKFSQIENKFSKIEKDLQELRHEMKVGFEKVNKRIDKLGAQLSYLENDAPTRKEFNKLDQRVQKLETS